MDRFMYYDFGIERVCNAIYVMPGKGAPIHQNRPFHGLVFHLHPKQKKEYVFSDGKKIEIVENEIIYLPKGSSYIVSSKELGSCYAINFELSESCSFAPFAFKVKNSAAFLHEFERITKIWREKVTAFQMQSKSGLYRILSMMQEEYRLKYITRSTAALIAPALEHIHSVYGEESLSIPLLAEKCGISEDYFRKIFKNVYGTSPRKYINGLKLSQAGELIRSGMYGISDAAELSGFADLSYFSREFKKYFGVSPGEYAKASRQ